MDVPLLTSPPVPASLDSILEGGQHSFFSTLIHAAGYFGMRLRQSFFWLIPVAVQAIRFLRFSGA